MIDYFEKGGNLYFFPLDVVIYADRSDMFKTKIIESASI